MREKEREREREREREKEMEEKEREGDRGDMRVYSGRYFGGAMKMRRAHAKERLHLRVAE